ncbi:histone deacetylase [Gordonia liuliyuniae]|uniref:Histone deacetylase n=1 Tax=Gordonia liuliyuniae TaxID=2911517 RepID=A0ABS9IS09_9ACTN|nr:histone deacetylase [Gordonia liuliyuniae]MCF8588332.1 histone deacetylase [Gordonia liuliyuniae]
MSSPRANRSRASRSSASSSSATHLWYVSYGSNLCADRLSCYLQGGRPDGGLRTYPGARDTTPPLDARPTTLPGRIFFAGESRTWRGGMAFYDHQTPGPTPAGAYLISIEQFADVAAQESDREPVVDGPLEAALRNGEILRRHGDAHIVDDGLYSRLVRVGTIDGRSALTFTSPRGIGDVPHTGPSEPYLAMISRGLRETHGWDDHTVAHYLRTCVSANSHRREHPGR